MIKMLPRASRLVLPDRTKVTMTVPFMRAYTELLVKTCHRRGAHAMGGMAALIPIAHDAGGQRAGASRGRARTRSARRGTGSTAPGSLTRICGSGMEGSTTVLGDRPNQVDRSATR